MKKYMKLSSFRFTTDNYNNIIKVNLGTEKSYVLKELEQKLSHNFTITDDKPQTLVDVAAQMATVIRKLQHFNLEIDEDLKSEFLIENLLLALTDVNVYKQSYEPANSYLVATNQQVIDDYTSAFAKAEGYHLARQLNHLPFSVLNSDSISDQIFELLDDHRFKITIYRQEQCVEHHLNGVLALSQGAKHQPAVIKVEYKTSSQPKIGLIGKGIMFDCGGYNIKTGDFSSMKTDMAGCGAVIGTLKTIANLDLSVNVVGYLMTTENLINECSFVPGDIITYRNGLSVEIGNTDAEGRLVLADGLLLAADEKCDTVIDIATLTGNAAAALGKGYAPLYSTSQTITDLFVSLNDNATDKVWPMPLAEEYLPTIEGNISDLRNISSSKHAGSITAALFLKYFAPSNANWVHIDMGAMSRKPEFNTPVNGYGVRLLTNFIQTYSK